MKTFIVLLALLLSTSSFAGSQLKCQIQMRVDNEIVIEENVGVVSGQYATTFFDFKDGFKISIRELNKYTNAYELSLFSDENELKITSYSVKSVGGIDFTISNKNYFIGCSSNH